jgi:hypothetical protein
VWQVRPRERGGKLKSKRLVGTLWLRAGYDPVPSILMVPGAQESDFSPTSTASIAIRLARIRCNDMKPGFDVVLTQ